MRVCGNVERPTARRPRGAWRPLLLFAALSTLTHGLIFLPAGKTETPRISPPGTPLIAALISPAGNKPVIDDPAPAKRATPNPTKKSPVTKKTTPPQTKPRPPKPAGQAKTPVPPAPIPDAGAANNRATAAEAPPPLLETTDETTDETADIATAASPHRSDNDAEQGRQATRNYLLGKVTDLLSRYLTYPSRARRRGWEGEVLVAFHVNAQGQLKNVRLARSSGYTLLDRSAIASLNKVGRIPLDHPARVLQPMNLELPVVYQLREG